MRHFMTDSTAFDLSSHILTGPSIGKSALPDCQGFINIISCISLYYFRWDSHTHTHTKVSHQLCVQIKSHRAEKEDVDLTRASHVKAKPTASWRFSTCARPVGTCQLPPESHMLTKPDRTASSPLVSTIWFGGHHHDRHHLAVAAQYSDFSNGDAEHGPVRLHVPSLPLNAVEALPEVGVEDLMDRGLCQAFPAHPHYICTLRSCSSHHLIQLTTWWLVDSSAPLFS